MVSFSSLYKSTTVTRKALTSFETCFLAKFSGANIWVVMEKLNSSNIVMIILAFINFPNLATKFPGANGLLGKIKF